MLSAILVATGLLFVAQTEAAGAAGSGDTAQARALLWSGAQAIMSSLNDQRDRILIGEIPALDPQYVIYENSARAGVVRLLSVGPGASGGAGESLLAAEAGKLDLNHVDAAALARTEVVDRATADAIISWRDGLGRPVQSIGELLNVPGVTIETLYGSLEPLVARDAALDGVIARRARLGAGLSQATDEASAAPARGLADVVTVFAVEPAVQYTGMRQINLNVPWSDELGKRVEDRFGKDAATVLKTVFESGTKFDSDAALVKAMRAYKTPPEQWPAILDAFTTDSGPYHFGRLDINAAPREALMGLPGVTAEQAAQIVNVRQELSPQERGTITWLVANQIIAPEAFEQLAGHITNRCWTYRVRIAAGEVPADQPEGRLDNPLVQELVIDLSGPKPRIAYLRDVSLLRDAALIAAEATRSSEGRLEVPDVSARAGAAANAQPDEAATSRPANAPRGPQRQPAASRPGAAGPASSPAAPASGGDAPAPNADGASAGDSGAAHRVGRWTSGG